MRLFLLIFVVLTIGFSFLLAESAFKSGFTLIGYNGEKEIIQPKVTPIFNPPVIKDRNQPKGENPTPFQIDYQPVFINRNDPKEANPVYAPMDYDQQITDRNELKEAIIGNESGQIRVDPDTYEPDDTAVTAKYFSVTSTLQSQNHTLHIDYDTTPL